MDDNLRKTINQTYMYEVRYQDSISLVKFNSIVVSEGYKLSNRLRMKSTKTLKYFIHQNEYDCIFVDLDSGLAVCTSNNCVIRVVVDTNTYYNYNTWHIYVASNSEDYIKEVFEYFQKLLPPYKIPVNEKNFSQLAFWTEAVDGGSYISRRLEMPDFNNIKHNYSENVSNELERLITSDVENLIQDAGGKLILFTGAPGVGKTFAIRAMVKKWSKQCRIHYILDPERFFNNSNYMHTVILDKSDDDDDDYGSSEELTEKGFDRALATDDDQFELSVNNHKSKINLIILEDAGELVASDAKLQTGQGFARLLNLTSGMLGQGMRVLVLITTNEKLHDLHEAVARSGRCISNIEFDKFSVEMAKAWLTEKGVEDTSMIKEPTTLADLYAIISKTKQITNFNKEARPSFGFANGVKRSPNCVPSCPTRS